MVVAHASTPTGEAILAQATDIKQRGVPPAELQESAVALATGSTHVAGQLVPCLGDACPATFAPPPFASRIGDTIASNRVCLCSVARTGRDVELDGVNEMLQQQRCRPAWRRN